MRVVYDIKTGAVTTIGVDMGGKVEVAAFSEHEMTLVLKVGGGKVWRGVGMPYGYASAHYALYRVDSVRRSGVFGVEFTTTTMPLMSWDVKQDHPTMLPRTWGEVEKVGDNPDTEDGRWPTFTEQQAQTAAMMAQKEAERGGR